MHFLPLYNKNIGEIFWKFKRGETKTKFDCVKNVPVELVNGAAFDYDFPEVKGTIRIKRTNCGRTGWCQC